MSNEILMDVHNFSKFKNFLEASISFIFSNFVIEFQATYMAISC